MISGFKAAVIDLGLNKEGIAADDVGSHTLISSDDITMKLNGISDSIIKKGHWTSMAFLQYIHNWIGNLLSGVTKAMKNKVSFRNVSGMQQWKGGVQTTPAT